jgi:hypothetical protein
MGGKDQFLAKKSVFCKVGGKGRVWEGQVRKVRFQPAGGVVLFIKRYFQKLGNTQVVL